MKRALLALFLLGTVMPTAGCVAAAVGLGAGYGYEMHQSRQEDREQGESSE